MADETPTRPARSEKRQRTALVGVRLTPEEFARATAIAKQRRVSVQRLLVDALSGEGICGDEAKHLFVNCAETMPSICELRHGHASEWHEDLMGKRWRHARRRPPVEPASVRLERHSVGAVFTHGHLTNTLSGAPYPLALAHDDWAALAAALDPATTATLFDQRDAAIERARLAEAHDRQPYPTAAAYEAVCHALHKYRDLADRATAALQRSSLAVDEADHLRREFETRITDRPEASSLANRLTAAEAEVERMRPVLEAGIAWLNACGSDDPKADIFGTHFSRPWTSTTSPPTPHRRETPRS